MLKISVPFTCHFVACSSRIKVDTHAHRHGHCNPRTCAPRVNEKMATRMYGLPLEGALDLQNRQKTPQIFTY